MDIKTLAADYAASTQYVTDLVTGLSNSDLDRRHGDGWTPRQVIHHLADSEAQSYARLRRLVAEPAGTIIQGYDEGAWAQSPILGYTELPIEHSFAVYQSVRAASLDVLLRLEEADLERAGVHTEAGPYSIGRWIKVYSNHPRDHGNQIKEALG